MRVLNFHAKPNHAILLEKLRKTHSLIRRCIKSNAATKLVRILPSIYGPFGFVKDNGHYDRRLLLIKVNMIGKKATIILPFCVLMYPTLLDNHFNQEDV